MSTSELPTDYRNDPAARQAEWHRYYSEKRIVHQWLQVHLLEGLPVRTVLEVGPSLGLVTALLDNAGYEVTTLDVLPSQYPRAHIGHIEAELTAVAPERIAGFDAIICCETLEHLHWERVDDVLATFRAAQPGYLVLSVPYMGLQLDWRLYFNSHRLRTSLSFKKLNFLKRFRFDDEADPWGHKWEVGYRGRSLKALEAKFAAAGWAVQAREFTAQTRSVFYRLIPN